jgi:ATP-dependent DNA helicase PIF1
MQLSHEFQYVLDSLEKTRNNMFITGRAGTGKSTLLQLFRKTSRKKVVVLAPTGIAALNVGGQTIHSFFNFPARLLMGADIKKRRKRKMYKNLEMLIIDEISMVRADLLDAIDLFLRKNRENNQPFGGVQMVFFGDLFQLPPVVATEQEKHLFHSFYPSPYFFSAEVFANGFELEMVELRQTYRQTSRHFLRLLDAVRTNTVDYDDLEDLNERYLPQFESSDYYVTLSARNATVDLINRRELQELAGPEHLFQAGIKGDFNPRLFPTDAVLRLRPGAQVMFVKNDPKRQFVNGTVGKVYELDEETIKVSIEQEDGRLKIIEVEPMSWEILKYSLKEDGDIDTEVAGSFEQYPLRLAWAITIHKSQGKTFDKVIIEMGRGAFEHGQTYVALSRCRTLDGIVLKHRLRFQDILVDERIVDFYERNF